MHIAREASKTGIAANAGKQLIDSVLNPLL